MDIAEDKFLKIISINGSLCRIIEKQSESSTLKIVDSINEQDRLEDILEQTKPKNKSPGRHYLHSTPFRYPPLKHGSRFGGRNQKGIFYGGQTEDAAITECAFYRCMFYLSMEKPPNKNITTEHEIFWSNYSSPKACDLTTIEEQDILDSISHPSDYAFTKSLGNRMRQEKVEVFKYLSARGKNNVCIGVFEIGAIEDTPPYNKSSIYCEISNKNVNFRYQGSKGKIINFELKEFNYNGFFPFI